MDSSTSELTRTDRVRAWSRTALALMILSALVAPDASAQGQVVRSGNAAVGPGDAVITVHGFCADEPVSSGPCDTVVTRAQFDKLAEALLPNMPQTLRLKVAGSYARMMRMAAAAQKRGLDKSAAFAEELRYARLQLLSQDLMRVLQEEAQNVNDAEVADYYDKHRRAFERATLERIFIPGSKRVLKGSVATDGADLAELALTLRRRAVEGESLEGLQVEAFKAAGVMVANPHTKMESVLRDSLPPSHEGVMDLRTGDVSEVLSDPGGGHFIYKMIEKHMPDLGDLAPEIRKRIASQRYRDSLKAFEGDVVFNDTYFDPPEPRRALPAGMRRPHRMRRDR
jgi:hypothetical protein